VQSDPAAQASSAGAKPQLNMTAKENVVEGVSSWTWPCRVTVIGTNSPAMVSKSRMLSSAGCRSTVMSARAATATSTASPAAVIPVT
jgi:hypothetical protein